jgi:hypothetical protein
MSLVWIKKPNDEVVFEGVVGTLKQIEKTYDALYEDSTEDLSLEWEVVTKQNRDEALKFIRMK